MPTQVPAALAVRARNAAVEYEGGLVALEAVSFEMKAGERLMLVGPSGCGKSTLLRAMAGLTGLSAGTIEVFGRPVGAAPGGRARRGKARPAERTRQAFVFQDATLLPWRTVEGNVALPFELAGRGELAGPDKAAARSAAVQQALRRVGLFDDRRLHPAALSGGMQMRVSLARALVTQPKLLLLDEPFGALDELTRQRLNEELLALSAELGWALVGVTHSVAEAVFLGTRVLVMTPRPGRIAGEHWVELPTSRDESLLADPRFGEQVACVRRLLREAAA